MHALKNKTLQEQRYSKLLKLLIYNILIDIYTMYKDLLSINEQRHLICIKLNYMLCDHINLMVNRISKMRCTEFFAMKCVVQLSNN